MADPQGVTVSLADLLRLEPQARGFSFLPRQPLRSVLSGRRASRVRGRGLDFEELRAYLPGDDVRTIDWRVTARARKPYVRVFTAERDRPLLLLVDQRGSMFFASRRAMKSVVAAEAAALASWKALAQGDRLGAVVFGDDGADAFRPHRSRGHVLRILEAIARRSQALATAETELRSAGLDDALDQAVRLVTHDHLVVILSDFEGVGPSTRERVRQLAAHNDVLAMVIHDPLSRALPNQGKLVVSDGELQVEVDTGSARTRERLTRATSHDRLAPVLAWQRELGVGVLPLSTAEPTAAQVRRLLGAR